MHLSVVDCSILLCIYTNISMNLHWVVSLVTNEKILPGKKIMLLNDAVIA